MTWLSGFIAKQARFILNSSRYAMLQTTLLALFSYTSWLAIIIVGFVTMRKGWRFGIWLLVPAVIANAAPYFDSDSTIVLAMMNAILGFVPCFVAACVLRATESWRWVAVALFLMVTLVIGVLQIGMPDFIMAQFLFLQSLLRDAQVDSTLLSYLNDKTGLNKMTFASYLLGLQALGVVISTGLSLICARSLQSKLFNPGAFRKEILNFRCDKTDLILLMVLLIAVSQHSMLAVSLLPLLVFYFFLAGLSLSFDVFSKKKPILSVILCLTTLVTLPFVMVPVYVLFGSLDSLINLRLYLPSDADKKT